MAHRFIVGASPREAAGVFEDLWKRGVATSVDLLGEATITSAEADRYAARCAAALDELAAATRSWPDRPLLEADSDGRLARANLSVKVSALTPLLRPTRPSSARRTPRRGCASSCAGRRRPGAHLHIDMESFDSREAITDLVLELLAEPSSPTARAPGSSCRPTCATRPSCWTGSWPGRPSIRAPTRS
jgi:RHH-type proline utilization regulon transcriptional repressor/proline dehydrogenase/delta 1-pyrroline-5-carboxylate dehydrogenase